MSTGKKFGKDNIPEGATHFKNIEGNYVFFKKIIDHRRYRKPCTDYFIWGNTISSWENLPYTICESDGSRQPISIKDI